MLQMLQNKKCRTDIFSEDFSSAIKRDDHVADKFLHSWARSTLPEMGNRRYSTVGSSSIIEGDAVTITYSLESLLGTRFGASVDSDVDVQKPSTPTLGNTGVAPESIINNWQLLATSNFSEQSYLFILKLARKKEGWRGPGSRPLNASSLSNLLKFWNKISAHATEPEFALAPDGNIQAEWYKDERHFIEIKFTPLNMISFGLFYGDKVLEGIAAPNDIIAILSSHAFKPLQWSYEG